LPTYEPIQRLELDRLIALICGKPGVVTGNSFVPAECHECCLLRRISLVVICFFPARCIFALYVDCLESFPRHCWLFVPSLIARKRGNRTTGAKVRYRCRRCSSRLQMLVGHERFAVSCPLALIGGAFYRFLCIGSQFRSPLPPPF
jgi:hypothetical protein